MHAPTSVATPQSGVKTGAQVVEEFWDMPQRLRSPAMTEAEMEAITVRVRRISIRNLYSSLTYRAAVPHYTNCPRIKTDVPEL